MKKGETRQVSSFPASDSYEVKLIPKGRGCNPIGWIFAWRTQRNMDKFLKEHDKRTRVGEGQAPQRKN